MSGYLCVRVEFLAPVYHGRGDDAGPEWPPSPHRVLQALVAAAAARARCGLGSEAASAALHWLEARPAPTIVAAAGHWSAGYVLSVPNNAMDLVGRAWARGNESGTGDANPATHRTFKLVRPTYLGEPPVVHYVWALEGAGADTPAHARIIGTLARSMVVLGWGNDQVVSCARLIEGPAIAELAGERWQPIGGLGNRLLRTPKHGSVDEMRERHRRFLERVGPNGFDPVPPPKTYVKLGYRRDVDPVPVPYAAFSLLNPSDASFRAFSTAGRALTVAGMLRHATRRAAEQAGWGVDRINAEVLGHLLPGASGSWLGGRFAFIPVPSLEYYRNGAGVVVGGVRRVLLTAVGDAAAALVDWARIAMPDMDLIDESTGEVVATLARPAATDAVLRRYVTPASEWATVTPVVVPGYDDPAHYRRRIARGVDAEEQRRLLQRLDTRMDQLFRKAIVQSGYSETMARHAQIAWRTSGFWPGNARADRYGVPNHLKHFPRYHVQLSWRDATGRPVNVQGPVVIGAGRYFGLGLFASPGS